MPTELYFLLGSMAVLAFLFSVKSYELFRGSPIMLPRFRRGCDAILQTVMPFVAKKVARASTSWIVLLAHRVKAAVVEAIFGVVRTTHGALDALLRELARRRAQRGPKRTVSFHLKHIEGPRNIDTGA